MTIVKIRITGRAPILMNNPASMKRADDTSVKAPKIPSPKVEAALNAYKNDDGQLYIPAFAFRASLLRGGVGRKIGKTAAWTVFSASVFCVDEQCLLYDPDTKKPIKKYEIDTRRAVVQRNGILRSRPMIEKWACDLTLEVDDEMLQVGTLIAGLTHSGKIVGVLDFRIEKKGWFGRYVPELIAA